jgi:hypothetical protein
MQQLQPLTWTRQLCFPIIVIIRARQPHSTNNLKTCLFEQVRTLRWPNLRQSLSQLSDRVIRNSVGVGRE